MAEKYGFIITVEEYGGDIPSVDYACDDGNLVFDLFTNKFGIAPEHISRYRNSEFTCARFCAEFRYHLSQLSTDTILYFYYAGHGFFADGKNYLTTYETSRYDLAETSIPFEDVVLDGFRKCPATTFIAFVDACAQGLSDNSRALSTRGFGYQLTNTQFNQDGFNYALYFACSPEEKAYPSDELKHGIWTWHLNKAFEEHDNAFGLQPKITASNLKEHLRNAVVEYMLKSSDDATKKQTPYAIISSNSDITIYEPAQAVPSFESQVLAFEQDFFLNCFTANMEHCIVDYIYPDTYDYAKATIICNYLNEFMTLPFNWQGILNKMQFISSRISRNEPIQLSLNEQVETLEDIELLVESTYIDLY